MIVKIPSAAARLIGASASRPTTGRRDVGLEADVSDRGYGGRLHLVGFANRP